MHTLHVITLVPATREAIAILGPFAIREEANVRVVSVVMESMGLPFMSEETSIGRESGVRTIRVSGILLAFVWSQMGVQIFAGRDS